jgi:hypothetical protein
VAAGVSLLGCAAGIMVTASHNTKEYNGYKVGFVWRVLRVYGFRVRDISA